MRLPKMEKTLKDVLNDQIKKKTHFLKKAL